MEVVLGPRTLARLHTAVGQLVTVDGADGPVELNVVGEAIFPFLGNGVYGGSASMSFETLHALGADVRVTGFLIDLTPGTDPFGMLVGRALWKATVSGMPILDSWTLPVIAVVWTAGAVALASLGIGLAGAWRPGRSAVAAHLRSD